MKRCGLHVCPRAQDRPDRASLGQRGNPRGQQWPWFSLPSNGEMPRSLLTDRTGASGQSRRMPRPSAENPQGCFDSAGPHPQISLGFCETMWWNESKHPEGSAGEGGMELASRSPPPEQLPPRLYQRRPICLPGAVQGGEEGLEADPLFTGDTAHSLGQG